LRLRLRLLLLSAVVLLGILSTGKAVHRNLSLVTVVFVLS
jgi:hypothetical protein